MTIRTSGSTAPPASGRPGGVREHVTRPPARRRWAAVLLGMAAVTGAAALADPVMGVDLAVDLGAGVRSVGQPAITLVSLGVGMAAWASLEVLERWTDRARLVWTTLAAVVLVVSLPGPLAATSTHALVVLLCLHLLLGMILVWGLPDRSRRSSTRRAPAQAGAARRRVDERDADGHTSRSGDHG